MPRTRYRSPIPEFFIYSLAWVTHSETVFSTPCAKRIIRIRTNGDYDWRTDLYDVTAESFGVGTKSVGIDAACQFSTQMLRNLERAVEHEDMTEELADVLPISNVTVEHRIITGVEID
jgi:hypothetical protein